jgi:hypothetical protein
MQNQHDYDWIPSLGSMKPSDSIPTIYANAIQ